MKEQNNIKQAYIPAIEEMQSRYEDDLRREASKSFEYEGRTGKNPASAWFRVA